MFLNVFLSLLDGQLLGLASVDKRLCQRTAWQQEASQSLKGGWVETATKLFMSMKSDGWWATPATSNYVRCYKCLKLSFGWWIYVIYLEWQINGSFSSPTLMAHHNFLRKILLESCERKPGVRCCYPLVRESGWHSSSGVATGSMENNARIRRWQCNPRFCPPLAQ